MDLGALLKYIASGGTKDTDIFPNATFSGGTARDLSAEEKASGVGSRGTSGQDIINANVNNDVGGYTLKNADGTSTSYTAAGEVKGTSGTPTSNMATDSLSGYNNRYADSATTSAEKASYQDIIDNLSKLLGYSATKREQGVKSISDEFANTQALQNKTYDTQKLQNVQNKEKGYNEVGTFANTSNNNLKRLLQGANAGRSSVGQVLAPYMVGRSADTRRKAVTDTAGENERNIDTAQAASNQSISNQKLKSLQDFENSMLGTMNDLESQKRTAQLSYDMANGLNYGQARDKAANLTSNINNRYLELSNLFNKYKPNYEIKEAPALSTYQVDPAKLSSAQTDPTQSSFYLNQLKKKKELGL